MKLINLQKGEKTLLRIKWLVLSLISFVCNAQVDSVKYEFRGYNYRTDTIINHNQLNRFFAKLDSLENYNKNSEINILHIGDSHIQADILTREIRNSLQKKFGNAGRGLIFPFRLTKSNESSDIHSSTDNNWQWVTVKSRNREFEPGISGASIKCTNDIFSLSLKINKRDSADNSFNKFQLICRNDTSGLLAFVDDSEKNIRKLLAFSNDTSYETEFNIKVNQTKLQSYGNLIIDGIVLKNGNKGVLYHVAGINGAHFTDFNHSSVFYAELPFVNPDLIIVSLGTNEGVNSRITSQSIKNEIESMLSKIRTAKITAPVLLITPFDNFYRRKKFNNYLSVVRKGIVEACSELNIACMDMYEISGGFKSAAVWKSNGMITADRIHYTAGGYKLQGKMIYNTLINSYTKYVAHKF